MGLRDLSIRAKVAITILSASLVMPGPASAFVLLYGGQERFALAAEHALVMAGTARNPIEAAIAQDQAGRARGRLGSLGRRTPFEEFLVAGRDRDALGTSRLEEEGLRRAGTPLPDSWDIPPEGLVLSGRGQAVRDAGA